MDEVNLVEYDPCWQTLFAQKAERIWQALGNNLVAEIEHIGSTAVQGMAAKPVIDIMVGVHSLVDAKSAVPILESLGYIYWCEDPRPGRMFFVKGMPPSGKQRTHHVHIVEVNSEFWEQKLFCDYLRKHPEQAKRYEALVRARLK
ncbi:MAG: GrpB family protein [Nostoc sp.]|uniref:GrpB family protein n=1 Tax=Nostoc sp. TaxID=1180 RepID=UPI002FF95BEA